MKTGGTNDKDARMVEFLYGEMNPSDSKAFEGLLAEDSELAEEAGQNQRVLELFRSGLVTVEPAPEVTARVLEAAAREVQRPSWAVWFRDLFLVPSRRYALGAALSVVLVCGAVVAVYKLKGLKMEEKAKRPRVRAVDKAGPRPEAVAAARPEGGQPGAHEVTLVDKVGKKGAVNTWNEGREGIDGAGKAGFKTTVPASPEDQTVDTANKDVFAANDLRQRKTVDRGIRAIKRKKFPLSNIPVGGATRGGDRKGSGESMPDRNGLARQKGPPSQLVPVTPPASKGWTAADGAYNMALTYQRKGNHKRAVRMFASLAAKRGYPRRNKVLLQWARSEMALGRYRKARQLLNLVRSASKTEVAEARRLRRRITAYRTKRRYAKPRTRPSPRRYYKQSYGKKKK